MKFFCTFLFLATSPIPKKSKLYVFFYKLVKANITVITSTCMLYLELEVRLSPTIIEIFLINKISVFL